MPALPPTFRLPLAMVSACLVLSASARAGTWAWQQGPHPTQTGEVIDITEDGQLVARFVFGDGQPKPYLHVFEDGIQLTKGDSGAVFPHHRGIFIGWDKLRWTDPDGAARVSDLWHLDDGSTMRVAAIEKLWADADSVTLIARIEWRSSAATGNVELIEETRSLSVSRPDGNRTQVEAYSQLRAARGLMLNGDRQHAGIHFRAAQEVNTRSSETSYLSSPQGGDGISGADLQWCRLLFPLGTRWFSVLQLRAPGTPSLEISMRDYGRFGFFFRRTMVSGEMLSTHYRFIIRANEPPAEPPEPSTMQLDTWRAEADAEMTAFTAEQAADRDGDGWTLAEERIAGTNPFDAASRFHIRLKDEAGGGLMFEFDHLPAKTYRVWTSSGLTDWNPVTDPVFTFPAVGTARWSDPESPLPSRRFYKLEVE